MLGVCGRMDEMEGCSATKQERHTHNMGFTQSCSKLVPARITMTCSVSAEEMQPILIHSCCNACSICYCMYQA